MGRGAIARVRLGTYRFPFREAWPSAEGAQRLREGLLVALEDDEGAVGVGESAPFHGFGLESPASSGAALRLAAPYLVGLPFDEFRPAAGRLRELAPVAACPCARAAIATALLDLVAQRAGRPLARELDPERARDHADANAAIPRLPADLAAASARDAVAAGARAVKLKVGGAPLAEDIARVQAVRDAIGGAVALRVDANGAWSEAEAVASLRALAPFDLEYAEQPVAAGDVEALGRVRAGSGVPIAADESLTDAAVARRIAKARAVDVFIVKPGALGGVLEAQAVIEVARAHGIAVTVTSFLDSAVGRAAALHLAASLGDGRSHGVATGWALADDLAAGVAERAGRVPLPAGSGLGDTLRAAAAARTEPIANEVEAPE